MRRWDQIRMSLTLKMFPASNQRETESEKDRIRKREIKRWKVIKKKIRIVRQRQRVRDTMK